MKISTLQRRKGGYIGPTELSPFKRLKKPPKWALERKTAIWFDEELGRFYEIRLRLHARATNEVVNRGDSVPDEMITHSMQQRLEGNKLFFSKENHDIVIGKLRTYDASIILTVLTKDK